MILFSQQCYLPSVTYVWNNAMVAFWMAAPLMMWLLLTFSLRKTSLGETGCLDNLYFLLTGCLDIQFFTPLFLTQSVRLPLVTYPSPSSICVTYRTPCHTSGHQVLPTQPLLREAGSFLRLTIIEGACLYSHT